jgi:hypothetical protein
MALRGPVLGSYQPMVFPVDLVAAFSRPGEECGCSCEEWEHESDDESTWPLCSCVACGTSVDWLGRHCRVRILPEKGLFDAIARGCVPKEGSAAQDFPGSCGDCKNHVALLIRRMATLRARRNRERSRSPKRKILNGIE